MAVFDIGNLYFVALAGVAVSGLVVGVLAAFGAI